MLNNLDVHQTHPLNYHTYFFILILYCFDFLSPVFLQYRQERVKRVGNVSPVTVPATCQRPLSTVLTRPMQVMKPERLLFRLGQSTPAYVFEEMWTDGELLNMYRCFRRAAFTKA